MVEANDDPNPRRRDPLTLALDLGSLLLPAALLAFGIEHVVFAGAVGSTLYPWVLGSPPWNYALGGILIALSVAIGIQTRVPLAAGVLGTILCSYGLILYVPRITAHLHDPGPWTDIVGLGSPLAAACELLAMGGAAWVLAASGTKNPPRLPGRGMGRLARVGSLVFAATLVVFGVQHFLYTDFLATLIPSWIPWHVFWEYFVGAAFIGAAVAIATNKAAGPAALLLGAMFVVFVVALHIPRAVAAGRSPDEWTSTIVAVAMSGGAFVLARASRRRTGGGTGVA